MSFAPGQTLRDLYNERVPYYEKYADITVNELKKSMKKVVDEITYKLYNSLV